MFLLKILLSINIDKTTKDAYFQNIYYLEI